MAWAPQVWEKLAISNYLRQVNSQQKSTKQKCDFCIKHLSGGTSKCRNARDSAKVALSWLGATWFWSDFFLTGFWPDSIYLIFDHIVCVWFCIYGMYIYIHIYIYIYVWKDLTLPSISETFCSSMCSMCWMWDDANDNGKNNGDLVPAWQMFFTEHGTECPLQVAPVKIAQTFWLTAT